MQKLLPIHQRVLLAAVLAVLLQVLFYLFLLHPRMAAHAAAGKELEKMQQRLASSQWPQDAGRLQQLLEEQRQRLKGSQQSPGVEQQTAQFLTRASLMYDARIREFYGNKNDFYRNVSRLDFQEGFTRLQNRLREQHIPLQSPVLNLTEDTTSAYNYQLMLQLWTLEQVCTLFHNAGLQTKNPLPSPGKNVPVEKQGGEIALLPVRAFLREEKAPRPFLLELPVALTLYGSIEQFESFCAGMQSSDLFLGIRAFALTALPPEVLTADEQGRLTNGTLRFELVCNGFYQF